jgi:hypothetical protein
MSETEGGIRKTLADDNSVDIAAILAAAEELGASSGEEPDEINQILKVAGFEVTVYASGSIMTKPLQTFDTLGLIRAHEELWAELAWRGINTNPGMAGFLAEMAVLEKRATREQLKTADLEYLLDGARESGVVLRDGDVVSLEEAASR